jgi:hypothetical protein
LLLGLPRDLPFDVLAVALDDDWSTVDEFVKARDSDRMVRANRKMAEEKFALSSLPQTVLMAPDGRLLLRVNGARDWSDQPFVSSWTVGQ